MIPSTVGTLLAFLALVIPGLVFELLRERRRPFIEETAFREVSRIALTSALFSAAAILIVGILGRLVPGLVADPAEWLRQGRSYLASHLWLIGLTLALIVSISTTMAILVDHAFRSSAPGRMVAGSIWFSLFRRHRPASTLPWVHLRLTDETEIWGYVGDYTPDQQLENRELVIENPRLQYRKKGQTTNTILDKWSFISVRGDDILWMKVQYIDRSNGEIVAAVFPESGIGTTLRNVGRSGQRHWQRLRNRGSASSYSS